MTRTALCALAALPLAACQDLTAPADPVALPPAASPQFSLIVTGLTDLGVPFGVNWAFAYDVNDFGQIVGDSDGRAFLYENGAFVDLGSESGFAFGINGFGQIVGTSTVGAEKRAFLWHNGHMQQLASEGPAVAFDINRAGQIVGQGVTASGEIRTTFWASKDAAPDYLASPAGTSAGYGMNDAGQIVGHVIPGSGDMQPTFWASNDVAPQDLGTLGGSWGQAVDINNAGQIVGGTENSAGELRATLWPSHAAAPLDLGTLGGTQSSALGINDLGQVVGESQTGSGDGRAFLWMDGTMYELGTLPGMDRSTAWAINNNGDVVGYSGPHAVRWSVVVRAVIDVEPGDAGNTIRLGGPGSITVVILGSPYFNAAEVAPLTVTLGDENGSDTPVLGRRNGEALAVLRDVNRDGYADLELKFDKKQMIDRGDLSSATTQLILLGSRRDGKRIRGVNPVSVR